MKEALLKKRYGIPAALLLALLLAGTAFAWYQINTISSETNVNESLTTSNNIVFSDPMYPGESNTWKFDIKNSASVGYTVKADVTIVAPDGVSITSFTVNDENGILISDETEDLGDGSAEFSIDAHQTITCKTTITAAGEASTGSVTVTFVLNRA